MSMITVATEDGITKDGEIYLLKKQIQEKNEQIEILKNELDFNKTVRGSQAEMIAKNSWKVDETPYHKKTPVTTLRKPIKIALGKTESTSFPWWFIVCPHNHIRFSQKNNFAATIAMSIIGPFFSRESAENHRLSRVYEYGRDSIVWCGSGYWSNDYKKICESGEFDPQKAAIEKLSKSLLEVLSYGSPKPDENPTMFVAWEKAHKVLSELAPDSILSN